MAAIIMRHCGNFGNKKTAPVLFRSGTGGGTGYPNTESGNLSRVIPVPPVCETG